MSKKKEDLECILVGEGSEGNQETGLEHSDDAQVLSLWKGKDYFKVWVPIPLFYKKHHLGEKKEQNHFLTPFLPLQEEKPSWAQ